jgi:hypothetical protein
MTRTYVLAIAAAALAVLSGASLLAGRTSPRMVRVTLAAVGDAVGAANGWCCLRDNAPCYAGSTTSNNCGGPLPWQCDCYHPGSNCWTIIDIKKRDTCVAGNQSNQCTETTAERVCYTLRHGECDNDAGGFSIMGLCWSLAGVRLGRS